VPATLICIAISAADLQAAVEHVPERLAEIIATEARS